MRFDTSSDLVQPLLGCDWREPRLAAEAIPDFLVDLETTLSGRPRPLRQYDQIHMRIEDLAAHILMLGRLVERKRVFFMGDSDGVVLGLACAAGLGLVPGPAALTLCDFDKRVLHFVDQASRRFGFEKLIRTQLYNVFDPLPYELDRSADIFHTNPPYGQFNGGRSVLAFVQRALAATRPDGMGLVIVANDSRFPWTHVVLQSVLDSLLELQLSPFRVLDECHSYHLDDQPELRSGIVFCAEANPGRAFDPAEPLPASFINQFYGRLTFPIPSFIPLENDDQLELGL